MQHLLHGDKLALRTIFCYVEDELNFASVCHEFFNIFCEQTSKFDNVQFVTFSHVKLDHVLNSNMYSKRLRSISLHYTSYFLPFLLDKFAQQVEKLVLNCSDENAVPIPKCELPKLQELHITVSDKCVPAFKAWIANAPNLKIFRITMDQEKAFCETLNSLNVPTLQLAIASKRYYDLKYVAPYVYFLESSGRRVHDYFQFDAFKNLHKLSLSDVVVKDGNLLASLSYLQCVLLDNVTFADANICDAFFKSIPASVTRLHVIDMKKLGNISHLKLRHLHVSDLGIKLANWINAMKIERISLTVSSGIPLLVPKIICTGMNIHLPEVFTPSRREITILNCKFSNMPTELPLHAMNRLEILRMNAVQLSADMFSNSITNCTRLTELSLNHCNLDTIPPAVALIPNLKKLYMDFNKIKTLPMSITQPNSNEFQQLELLSLESNKIAGYPTQIALPKLYTLRLFESAQQYQHSTTVMVSPANIERRAYEEYILEYLHYDFPKLTAKGSNFVRSVSLIYAIYNPLLQGYYMGITTQETVYHNMNRNMAYYLFMLNDDASTIVQMVPSRINGF